MNIRNNHQLSGAMKLKILFFILLASTMTISFAAFNTQNIYINNIPSVGFFAPLDKVSVTIPDTGYLFVYDGQHVPYIQDLQVNGRFSFKAGGALGNHLILLMDEEGQILARNNFSVDCKTELNEASGKYEELLDILYWTMTRDVLADIFRYNGQFHHTFVRWLRDHVHTMKGMKYYYPELKSGIDLYAYSQREDGMIWDNIYPRNKEKNWWDRRFSYGHFIREIENGNYEFKRIPIENDVEYLFIEGLYYTWKATGDHHWMKSHLDRALKAVEYSTSDPYRWSDKYQLLKRGFTIDTWDFQSAQDAALVDGNDIMRVELDATKFGVMFGDNTGMAMACSFLSEMLAFSGRNAEAEKIERIGKKIKRRLDSLAWNGHYYTHHIPEDLSYNRDLGVDQSKQVSLSNAYSLNRTLSHEQCVQIIQTYLNIRDEMPETSPGEWYTIYPPFKRGFGGPASAWEYMNGGVTPIVAGELAHGAFEHGYEKYGVDILNRVLDLANKTDDYLYCTYRGKIPAEPKRTFTRMDLKGMANVAYPGKKVLYNDKRLWDYESFAGVPFDIIDPGNNAYSCVELNHETFPEVSLPFNGQAESFYLLHTGTNGPVVGKFQLIYKDKTHVTDYIDRTKIGNWWIPNASAGRGKTICKKAWRSNNDEYVAFYIYGFNNPYPDKTIEQIKLISVDMNETWQVAGISYSDQPVFFKPDIISYGIPDNWGAAAVVYALIEGLVGVKDLGVAYDKTLLSPRWEAAGVNEASATVRYESSDGYVSYHYMRNDHGISLEFTGNASSNKIQLLLPPKKEINKLTVNNQSHDYGIQLVEESRYLTIDTDDAGVKNIEISWKN